MSLSGASNAPLDFNTVAARAPKASDVREPVTCSCGRGFWRVRPKMAQLGEKLCERCRERGAEVRLARAQSGTKRKIGDAVRRELRQRQEERLAG